MNKTDRHEFCPRASKKQKIFAIAYLVLFIFIFSMFSVWEVSIYIFFGLWVLVFVFMNIPSKRFSIVVVPGMVEGYDILNHKRVTIPLSRIQAYGIKEKEFKPSLKMHFNFHKRFYIQIEGGSIEAVLLPEDLNELNQLLDKLTSNQY